MAVVTPISIRIYLSGVVLGISQKCDHDLELILLKVRSILETAADEEHKQPQEARLYS